MKVLVLAVLGTLGFIVFGIVVGISACASVQGLNTCLMYFARALSNLL
jgi:hypothetical protein